MPNKIASVNDGVLTDAPAEPRRIVGLPNGFRSAASSVLIAAASLSAGLLFWHLATLTSLNFYVRFDNVPTPVQVATAFWHELGDKRFYFHILYSLRRIAIGYALAAALGIGLGLAVGRSRLARAIITALCRNYTTDSRCSVDSTRHPDVAN